MRRTALPLLSILLASAAVHGQSTWIVDDDGTPPGAGTPDAPYTSIRYALAQPSTQGGDQVLVLPGTYEETVDFLGKAVEVVAAGGPDETVIAPPTADSGVRFVQGEGRDSVLRGFEVTGGTGRNLAGSFRGGGVLVLASAPLIAQCRLRANEADLGGGLYAGNGGAPLLEDCQIVDNRAERGAGVCAIGAAVELRDTEVQRNVAHASPRGAGGGLYAEDAQATVSGSLFEENSCLAVGFDPFGAGMCFLGSSGTLADTTLRRNTAGTFSNPGSGGGISSSCDSSLELLRCEILENGRGNPPDLVGWQLRGGGLAGTATLRDCVVAGNGAQIGAGLYSGGCDLELLDCIVSDNVDSIEDYNEGGGVHGPATLVRSKVLRNRCWGEGSGTYDCELVDCEVAENRNLSFAFVEARGAGVHGGSATRCLIRDNVIELSGTGRAFGAGAFDATLIDCRVTGNEIRSAAGGMEALGAGMVLGSALRCELEDNRIEGTTQFGEWGGGAYAAVLERCTLRGNRARHGAGAHQSALRHCSLTENVASVAGGALSGAAVADASILWGNAPDEVDASFGTPTIRWSDVQGGWPGTGNFAADPLFWNPFGGDLHLRPKSPCIDAGDPRSPPDDDGSVADVGALAYEPDHCGEPAAYCEGLATSEGCTPRIEASGSPSATGSDTCFVDASGLPPGRPGMLFWSHEPASVPFLDGTRCVGLPIVRTPVQVSAGGTGACAGRFSFHFSQAYLAQRGLQPFDEIYCQYWFRDPGTEEGVGLSAGLQMVVCP